MDLLAHVGRRVRELREERHLSQVELAQSAGVSARQLARLESGSANLTLTTLDAIAGALGSRAAALLPRPPPPRTSRRPEINGLLEAAESLSDPDVHAAANLLRAARSAKVPLARLLEELSKQD